MTKSRIISKTANNELTEEEKENILRDKQKSIISTACQKAISSIKDTLIYPDDDEINFYTDESCQKSLINKIKLYGEKDGLYGTSELCSLLQSAVIDKEYAPDVLFGDSDSKTASTIYDAINLDMKSGADDVTTELIKTYIDRESVDEIKQVYTSDNLYAKQLANLPINQDGSYTIPRVTTGHITFTPNENNQKLNFRTIFQWVNNGTADVDWNTGIVKRSSNGEALGVLTEYKRGYNDQSTIEDALYQENREKNSWRKSMMINSSTGESEEYDYLGRQINKDKPPKIRIVGIKTLLEDEEKYENEMLNRALCNCGGSTYALDKQIEEAATGYKEMLSDWMTRDEFNNKPQESLANGF